MDARIEQHINHIEVDRWFDLDKFGEYVPRVRSVYCGDGQGDFEKRSYYTTIECLENYMVDCDDQIQLAVAEIRKINERNN
jgi:hypothetical protein